MSENKFHVAVLTAAECCKGEACGDPICLDIAIECPGVTDACRSWWDCSTCEPSSISQRDDVRDGGDMIHGVEHRVIDGRIMTPAKDCYIAAHDRLNDEAYELDRPPGRYLVEHDVGDGTELYLSIIPEPVVAAGSGGEEGRHG